MGISILEMVLRLLRQENFTADIAYPGQKYPVLTEPVAAVHLEKVDRANLTVTVEVSIICPASMGGGVCELEALRATEVLRWSGATCVQNGCKYDGVAQVYVVAVLATFTAVTEEDGCTIGPGFTVHLSDIYHPYAISFTATQNADHEVRHEIGELAPIGLAPGNWTWKIELEELIPAGSPEAEQPADLFELKLTTDIQTERYYHCRWTSVKREFTKNGLRKTRIGVAMDREVS